MFDPNLTREIATAELSGGGNVITATARLEDSLVQTFRETETLRNATFANRQNYEARRQELQDRTRAMARDVVRSDIFQCLKQNFGTYTFSHPSLQQQLSGQISFILSSFLLELVGNAAIKSNIVDVRTSISANGFLFDIDQGAAGFDGAWLAKVGQSSREIHSLLQQGTSLDHVVAKIRTDCQQLIGYLPPNHNNAESSPFRGNGIGNMLANDFVRTNFLPDAEHNSTLCLHTTRQLQNALLFKLGDRRVIDKLYGPSPATISSNVVDDVFADWE